MAAVFLTRQSRQYVKYATCTAVAMTGQTASYGSVTGVEATNIITVPGSAFVNGNALTFTSLTGGAGLVIGTKYYVVSVSGTSFQLATSQGGTAINFTTDITAATVLVQTDDLLVWSSEFRDTFSSQMEIATVAGNNSYAGPGTNDTFVPLSSSFSASHESDEVAHEPLRQSLLARSYWKFTMSSGATPLYAEVLDGDMLSDTAPNTP
jgi:hypothetical protein